MSQKQDTEMLKPIPTAPVVLVLRLDKLECSERVLIGEEYQLRRRLEGQEDARVLFDEERPLGTFLREHEGQLGKDWAAGAARYLKEALVSVIRRKEKESTAWEFLVKKHNYHDSVCIYAACQCWYYYVKNRTPLGAGKNADVFDEQIMGLTGSFQQSIWGAGKNYSVEEVLDNVQLALQNHDSRENTEARVWYLGEKRDMECLVVDGCFYPAILYYLHHLQDWGFCFCRCSNCGKMFVAPSRHHSLCSAECHKEKNRRNKREFDERARKNKFDVEYKNTSQRMRNRLNSLCKRTDLPEEEQEAAEESFLEFRREAVRRKKQIVTDEDYAAFREWMSEQERRFELFCEG